MDQVDLADPNFKNHLNSIPKDHLFLQDMATLALMKARFGLLSGTK